MYYSALRELRSKSRKPSAVLTHERKKEIEAIVNRIRKEHGIRTADFDLIEFLTLDYAFEVQIRRIEDDTIALLLVDEKHFVKGSSSNRVIIINQYILESDVNFRKRRFLCAHEFGHFILHKRADQATFAVRDTPDNSSLQEQEAEYFAYCLLMPAELIDNLYGREDARSDVERIRSKYGFSMGELVSELFNVTKTTAVWRLKELGKTENLE